MELCIKRRKRGGTGWLRPDNAGCIFAAWRRILLFSFAVLWFGVMFSPFTATYFLSSKSRQKSSLPLWRLLCKCLQIRLKNGGARTRLRSNRQAAGFFLDPGYLLRKFRDDFVIFLRRIFSAKRATVFLQRDSKRIRQNYGYTLFCRRNPLRF